MAATHLPTQQIYSLRSAMTTGNIVENVGRDSLKRTVRVLDELVGAEHFFTCNSPYSMGHDDIDDANDRIDELQSNMEDVEGENDVALTDILTDDFMLEYTEFDTADAMFETSPWTVESQADFEAILDGEFDQFVAENSQFENWEAMLNTAGTAWMKRQLGL